ncbi:hypothetical protein BDA99DRAFT_543257 [Phascolomyces articulosus]|uniref:Uncharacterized protein n=1 Tax=Phascolomyces articulosus TaxID=60185 RepID=A0AAD5JXF4_9FUNG|nr:hypothetical protein BDA99DRAFT_543257 [Phascolomyces articulosus]
MVSNVFPNSTVPFGLTKDSMTKIGKAIVGSSSTIPSGVFEGDFRDMYAKYSDMRSVDWVVWFLFVLPTVVCDEIFDNSKGSDDTKEAIDALASLIKGYAIAMSYYID